MLFEGRKKTKKNEKKVKKKKDKRQKTKETLGNQFNHKKKIKKKLV